MTTIPLVQTATSSFVGRAAQTAYEVCVDAVEAAILDTVTAIVTATPIEDEELPADVTAAIEALVLLVRPHVAFRLQSEPTT